MVIFSELMEWMVILWDAHIEYGWWRWNRVSNFGAGVWFVLNFDLRNCCELILKNEFKGFSIHCDYAYVKQMRYIFVKRVALFWYSLKTGEVGIRTAKSKLFPSQEDDRKEKPKKPKEHCGWGFSALAWFSQKRYTGFGPKGSNRKRCPFCMGR